MTNSSDFAPADRSPEAEIARRHRLLLGNESLAILDAVPMIVVILDINRQIVFGNAQFMSLIEDGSIETALGKRPGEFLQCIHAAKKAGGCGTTEFCSQCGAVKAILSGLEGRKDAQECQIRRFSGGREEALDLQVSSSPLDFKGERFTIFSICDISGEKRRQTLETVFFHDALNALSGLKSVAELIIQAEDGPYKKELGLIREFSERLIEEFSAQKQLIAAENGELKPCFQAMNAADVVRRLVRTYASHEVARGKHLVMHPESEEAILISDPALLERVAGNMVKNALEASAMGEAVILGCEKRDGEVVVWVHNLAVMPRNVQLRVFNRSFSTKSTGRGQGTYGMKLLGERYLGGRVWFESREGAGTTFYLSLPGQGLDMAP